MQLACPGEGFRPGYDLSAVRVGTRTGDRQAAAVRALTDLIVQSAILVG
ncbi:hypothetical protein [Rhizohabitans arisaemae]|nr:hypothetical protein [Rhizohabitans arisaemae]